MCNPAAVQVGVMIFSTAMQASQAQAQGQFQKGVADYNARVASNEATETQNAANEAENMQRQKTAELLSRQRAQLAASNVDLSSGSALQLQEDTLTLGEADAMRIRKNYASRVKALNTESELTTAQGGFAQSAGTGRAVGSLLSGAGSFLGSGVADKWFTPKSAAVQQPGIGGI